jgi:peptide/nickel transport system substrate-binding protein
MKGMVQRGATVGLLVATLSFTACGGGTSGSASQSGGSPASGGNAPLIINNAVAPATLDLSANACGFEDVWANNFYRRLIRVGREAGEQPGTTVQDPTKFVPDLATSWEISDDGKVYTFHLDPKAVFNDGTPIDSAAVKGTMERAVALGSCGFSFWSAEDGENLAKITTPDKTTVVATLKKPNARLLGAWAAPDSSVMDPKALAEHPDEKGQAVNPYWATHIAGGGGPFVLDSYAPNSKMEMSKNPKYTGPNPAKVAKVTVNFGQSPSTLLLQARSGAADITGGLSPDDLVSLEGQKGLRILKFPVGQFYSLGLNNKMAPFDNPKVREALSYAVPYQDLVDKVLQGYGEVYYGPIAHTLPFFNADASAPRETDMAKAKQLLEESGAQLPIKATMVLQQGASFPASMAAIIQDSWKQIGVDLKLQTLGAANYNTTVGAKKAQTFIRIDGPGVPDAGWLLGYDMVCGGPFNLSDICLPEADKLLNKALASTDPAEQQKLYDQITEVWRDQTPKIVLANIIQGFAVSNRVKNFDWSTFAPQELADMEKG